MILSVSFQNYFLCSVHYVKTVFANKPTWKGTFESIKKVTINIMLTPAHQKMVWKSNTWN